MDARAMLDALTVAVRLKDTTRHCYTEKGRHESVAEHCWMMTLMAFFMWDEFPEADMDKVMRMCVIHACFLRNRFHYLFDTLLRPSIAKTISKKNITRVFSVHYIFL